MSAGYPRRVMALLLAIGASGLVAACDKKAVPPPPIRPVLSVIVEPKAGQLFGPFTGTVEARYKSDLGFRAAGRMVARNANVGDAVAKGELLASLDPSVAQFALSSARADLANAQAQLTNAASTAQRQTTLLQTGSTTQAQVDTAVAGRDTAKARVNQAQASLVKAQEQLDYTSLYSDFDGVITSWSLEVGQVVAAGQTVVTVARPEMRDGVFDVPDDLLAKVRPGATFIVSLQADKSITVSGEVREISPQSDAATRTRRIRLTLGDVPEAFRLGTTVSITLSEDGAPTIYVPTTAILDKAGKASVWLANSGRTATLKPVILGPRQGRLVIVTAGLVKGDRVITAGVHSLSDGQAIKLLEP